MDILYLDNHLLVVRKPAGLLIQGDHTADKNLLDMGKAYLKGAFGKPGNVFLGLVHRLDRPVSGVVVFARTSVAARRLSDQFRRRTVEKHYIALVEGKVVKTGRLVHHIARRQTKSRIVSHAGQRAELSFERLAYRHGISCIRVNLATGRHHQIRVQFAHIGHPIVGDFKYGSRKPFPNRAIGLHAQALRVTHPTKKERMTFEAEPESFWPVIYLPVSMRGPNKDIP